MIENQDWSACRVVVNGVVVNGVAAPLDLCPVLPPANGVGQQVLLNGDGAHELANYNHIARLGQAGNICNNGVFGTDITSA